MTIPQRMPTTMTMPTHKTRINNNDNDAHNNDINDDANDKYGNNDKIT